MSNDLGVAAIRDRVLAAWRAAPDRFREDANAEEDLALGGYRDRAVVELAQNAADAAARAAVPGRLLLQLAQTSEGPVLVAANTGAALDAAGVRGLASLRASAKRDEHAVGRFGVGFAAVLALSDAPAVVSHGRGVRFSRADSADLVVRAAHDVPDLALELERRDGHVPVLRLPFQAEGVAPDGYDTAVILPLRSSAYEGSWAHDSSTGAGAALDLLERLLDDVGDPLLLALPGLHEIVVERPGRPTRRLADVGARWHTRRAAGLHTASDLADRPTEERQRPAWSVTWAVPRHPGADVVRVLHAPTPTDEPMEWPAVLVASFPLEPTRRHVAPGPARDALVAHAARAYADLLTELAADGVDALPLVPTGLPAGSLDADLREATLPLLAAAPVLAAAEPGAVLRPRDAVALETLGDDERVLGALAPLLAGLVPAPRSATAALTALGVARTSLADVVESLPSHPDPAWWSALYRGLAPLADDPLGREALAALPVPLADGRLVRGVRGLLLPGPDLTGADGGQALGSALSAAPGVLAEHGLRVVHPAALGDGGAADETVVRLLERLGAARVGAREVLDHPAARNALADVVDRVEDGVPLDEVADVVEALLNLVGAATAAGRLRPGDLPWLGDLPMPDADGEPTPAAGLLLAGSPAQALLDPEEVGVLDEEVAGRWASDVLEAVGVTTGLSLLRWATVETSALPDDLLDLDGAEDWADTLPDGSASEVVAVRDLDLVDKSRWPAALDLVSADPALFSAVRDGVRVVTVDGTVVTARSYTAWWLRSRLDLAGCADPEAVAALGLALATPPGWVGALEPGLRQALGLPRAWEDLDADGWSQVLASPRSPDVAGLLALWRSLAEAAARGDLEEVEAPHRIVALGPDGATTVSAQDAVVVDAPMWLQREDLGGLVVAPVDLAEALADVLDLDLAGEAADGVVSAGGRSRPVPEAVLDALPGAPRRWLAHDALEVDGQSVQWWVQGDGTGATVHAVGPQGLARGLAQAAGRWSQRAVVEALLVDPASAGRALAEAALEATGRFSRPR